MEKNCEGNGTFFMQTLVTTGGVLILLWWWTRKNPEKQETRDKAVNTDLQVCDLKYREVLESKTENGVLKFDKLKDDLNCNWKAVWVGDNKKENIFSNRHRTELTLNLDTGEVIRKHEILRHRATHVIATL